MGRKRRLFLHRLFDVRQDPPHQGLQLPGPFSRGHAFAGTNQQGIAEQIPQAAQAVTHGRLGDAQMVGGLGYIALPQQHIQVYEQVEVYAGNIHGQLHQGFSA